MPELPEVETPEIKDVKVEQEKPTEDEYEEPGFWNNSIFTATGRYDFFEDMRRDWKAGKVADD